MKKGLCKRTLAMLLALVSVLGLAACGGSGGENSAPPAGTQAPAATAPAETDSGNQGEGGNEPAGVPDRGAPDHSDIRYLSSLESLKKTDWTASWIWTRSSSEDTYVLLRKTFTLDQAVSGAAAYVSAVDKYFMWVNGELVVLDGCLKRGPTPVDSYYDTVAMPDLPQGDNTIAVLVAFNGRSGDGSIVPTMYDADLDDNVIQAGFLFEMNAGGQTVVSDSTWKVILDPAYKNRRSAGADYPNYDQSSMLAERNVYFDARDSLGDFTAADFDDSAWENATLIAKPGDLPFGDLYSAITQPILFGDYMDFANAASYTGTALAEDTVLELELPGNIQFTWYIECEAPAGKKLTVYTNTYTDQDGLANFKDTYITAEGAQAYENYPWRSGSKLIIEAEAGVTFTRLAYRPSSFNGGWVGSFFSSRSDLDQLWQESRNTIAICMRDTYMDCPDRERGPYMGDASNQIDAALYSYDQGGLDMTRKAILACIGWTPADGAIPSRAPSVKPQEIPNQSLAFMTSAYHYWLHSGDAETMTAYYEAFVNYLKLYEMKDGLPVYREGSWTWNDWGDKIDANLLQVGFYYYALRLTSALAEDLGITADADFFSERMTSIQENYHDAYYTPEGFKDPKSSYIDERANAMLALSGLASEEDYPLICDVIMSTYQASPFCEKYVLEALCVMGREDLAVQRMTDRYGFMLTDEWDTLWEQFTDTTGTTNHGWTAAPLYILSKYVAGIAPTAPGFAAYEIAPSDVLDQFSCIVWTPSGHLSAKLEQADGVSTLSIGAVEGIGTVRLPASWGSAVSVSGGAYELQEDGSILLTEAAGYTITVQ